MGKAMKYSVELPEHSVRTVRARVRITMGCDAVYWREDRAYAADAVHLGSQLGTRDGGCFLKRWAVAERTAIRL